MRLSLKVAENLHAESVLQLTSAIRELWPGEQQPGELAEALDRVAAEHNVPTSIALAWLANRRHDLDQVSVAQFLRVARGYVNMRAEESGERAPLCWTCGEWLRSEEELRQHQCRP